jgi:hypothetical protein
MCPCARRTITHQLLEELNATIHTLPTFSPIERIQRSWGSELTIQFEQYFFSLQFLIEEVALNGAMQ